MELDENDFVIPEDQKQQLDRIPGMSNVTSVTCHTDTLQVGSTKSCRKYQRVKVLQSTNLFCHQCHRASIKQYELS